MTSKSIGGASKTQFGAGDLYAVVANHLNNFTIVSEGMKIEWRTI